jgi:hypothetical protein
MGIYQAKNFYSPKSQVLPPSCFVISFKPKSASSANGLIASIHELRRRHVQFADLGTGLATGQVIYQRDWLRRIRCQPLGIVVNHAMRAAMNDCAHSQPKGT